MECPRCGMSLGATVRQYHCAPCSKVINAMIKRAMSELSNKEIAAELGLPVAVVSQRIARLGGREHSVYPERGAL